MLHLNRRRPGRVIFLAIATSALVVLGCTPAPKHQACTTDDECKADLGKNAYCWQSRCVECVTQATCGDGKRCVDGICKTKQGL